MGIDGRMYGGMVDKQQWIDGTQRNEGTYIVHFQCQSHVHHETPELIIGQEVYAMCTSRLSRVYHYFSTSIDVN